MNIAQKNLKHIVVLMMENRSFDHMLGGLRSRDQRIDGLTGKESNPDTTGARVKVQPTAQFQSDLQPDPGHHYPDVDLQLFNGSADRTKPSMDGFINAYFQKQQDVAHSRKILNYFTPEKLPVITQLARKYAVFNRWFSSIPGPTLPNRAFAHFGTSFGKTDMSVNYLNEPIKTIYERLDDAGHSAKIYYSDQTIAMAFLLKNQPHLFGTFDQFLADCKSGNLSQYSFIEPSYADDPRAGGEQVACDQHPDHDVQAGEFFMASVYNAIRKNKTLWESTALLIVYDEHGGIYDHVPPPSCTPDGAVDSQTGFKFDRLGVRVPAVLVSPWIPEGTVISPLDGNGQIQDEQIYEHASIPATATEFFLGAYDKRTPREKAARTFLNALSLPAPRKDFFVFSTGDSFDLSPDGAFSVSIDKPSANSKNSERPMSGLLEDQVKHLYELEMQLPPERQTHIDIRALKTEGQASDYMNQVMALLKPAAAGAGKQ
jgi:phospholipase C